MNDKIAKGNPSTFSGKAILAFVDILGWSDYVVDNWSAHQEGPIEKYESLKQAIPKNLQRFLKQSKDGEIEFKCRIQIVSDSIILSYALESGLPHIDMKMLCASMR